MRHEVEGRATRRRLAWALAACALFLAPPAAHGAGLAQDHPFPAPAVDTTGADAAFAPNGFAAVAWIETLAGGKSRVNVSLRPPGADWSAPQPMGETDKTVSGVQVTVNSAGAAAVTWGESQSPSTFIADVATRAAGGSAFGTPEVIAGGSSSRVAVDAAGNVDFLYSIVNSGMSNGTFIRTAAAGAPLMAAPVHTFSTVCSSFANDIAVAPSGDAIVGFGCSDGSFALRKAGVWGAASHPFTESGGPCPQSNLTFFSGMRVAIDSQGHPAAVLTRDDRQNDCFGGFGSSDSHHIVLALPAGGVMAAGPGVADSGTSFGGGLVPMDVQAPIVGVGGGSVVVAWLGEPGASLSSQATTRTYPGNGAGSPTAPQPLGDPNASAYSDGLSVNDAGDTLLSWGVRPAGKTATAFASFRPSGGAFGPLLPVTDGTADPTGITNGLAASGDGVVGYVQSHVAHARGFDVTPPQLANVSIPAAAQLGTPASFSAQASDLWGPVTFAWNFSDGTAQGAGTTHAFTAAGAHNVTVTAADAAGNSSSQSGNVAVLAAGLPALPELTALSETNKTFRVGKKPTATSAAKKRIPTGTTFRFTLSEPATVTISFAKAAPGRRSGKRCVKPTKRLAHRKRCTRFVGARGKLTRAGNAGRNSVAFSGRIGRKALKPGSYRATFVAGAQGIKGPARTLNFKVVR